MSLKITSALRRIRDCTCGSTCLQTAASLGAMAILTATTAPVLERYMNHAKVLRSKGEVKVLASVVQLLINDLGGQGVVESPHSHDYLRLLVSAGDVPDAESIDAAEWNAEPGGEAVGSFDDYLLLNAPGFSVKGGGSLGFGWDGPYLQAPLGADPWGNRYAASVGLLAAERTYVPVIVNAGPDGVISVPFRLRRDQMEQTFGDDIYYVLR